jgi:hypothetical protein
MSIVFTLVSQSATGNSSGVAPSDASSAQVSYSRTEITLDA